MVEGFQIKGGNTSSGQPKDRHSDFLVGLKQAKSHLTHINMIQ